jgi:NAD(P)-dependent dehydrogenase (short-subunit alcohol dehydrogenase family)
MLASSIAGMYVVAQGLPIGRRRKPEDIARVVLWLASKHAWFAVGHILVPVEVFLVVSHSLNIRGQRAKRHKVWPVNTSSVP